MTKELLVSNFDNTLKLALLEDGLLSEIHNDVQENKFAVGDLCIGKIKKLAPNLNAAFVNIGYGKDAFLHYHDLGPQLKNVQDYINDTLNGKRKSPKLKGISFDNIIDKNGTIEKVVSPGQEILVQITKEPISTKGPRISSEISLAGRYIVLVPFSDKISISKQIEDPAEKERIKTLIESIKPEGFGVIIRTAAENKKVAELHADINFLFNKWNQAFRSISKKKIPYKILSEMDRASGILRDNFNEEFKSIVCDDPDITQELKDYIAIIAPEKVKMVKYYDSHVPLFEFYNVERQIKQSFGKNVNIPNSKGGYLVIEHTEALHVVDVNSGNTSGKKIDQESSAFELNIKAATELSRQLKLRDMGGIIVVDFIDMSQNEHKRELYEHLKKEMARDKAKHKILPPSKFGLIQITRQRVRQETLIPTSEKNPNTNDKVEAPLRIVDIIKSEIERILPLQPGSLYIHVHPFIAAYLNINLVSIIIKWRLKYKRKLIVVSRDSFKYLEIKIYNKEKEEIFHSTN